MKKIILVLLLSSVVFYGCGSKDDNKEDEKEAEVVEKDKDKSKDNEKESSKDDDGIVRYTCDYTIGNVVEVDAVIESNGNIVTLLQYTNVLDYTAYEIDINDLVSASDNLKLLAEEDEGIEYSYEYDDETYTEYLTMDMTVIDIRFAIDNGFIATTTPDMTVVGLNETLDAVEAMNGTCVEE